MPQSHSQNDATHFSITIPHSSPIKLLLRQNSTSGPIHRGRKCKSETENQVIYHAEAQHSIMHRSASLLSENRIQNRIHAPQHAITLQRCRLRPGLHVKPSQSVRRSLFCILMIPSTTGESFPAPPPISSSSRVSGQQAAEPGPAQHPILSSRQTTAAFFHHISAFTEERQSSPDREPHRSDHAVRSKVQDQNTPFVLCHR